VKLHRFRELLKLQQFTGQFGQQVAGFGRSGGEELPAQVDPVHPLVREPPVHLGLDPDRIVGEEERVPTSSRSRDILLRH
jgi:hypothetical protein